MERSLRVPQFTIVKETVVYRVAPNRSLKRWAVIKEGKKAAKAKAKGLSKDQAVDLVLQLARKKAQPATVLIHKTRYIIERQLQLSS
jgi:hypothetical protein